ncbi:MAG: ribonuclease P [Candidatus Woesearchaeota archaeon]|jgi:ribonuclease P protein subunit RPR2
MDNKVGKDNKIIKDKSNKVTSKIVRSRKKHVNVDSDTYSIIKQLFSLAKETVKKNKRLANRYVFLARKIAMSKNIRLDSELKRQFCGECNKYILPGFNCRVRISNDCVIYHCDECKHLNKFRIK